MGLQSYTGGHSSTVSAKGRPEAFPLGITVEGATPDGEGRWCEFTGAPPPPARWRTSAKKQGVAPSTISPYRAARRRAG